MSSNLLTVFPAFFRVSGKTVTVFGDGDEAYAEVRLLRNTDARILAYTADPAADYAAYLTTHGVETVRAGFRVEQAHNDYLQMLSDAGILGFACAIAFVVLLMKSGIAAIVRRGDDIQRSIVAGALAGCFGILIHSFFDFPLRTPANALFFLLLVVLVVGNDVEKKKRARRGTSGR